MRVKAPATVRHTVRPPVVVKVGATGTVPTGRVTILRRTKAIATGVLRNGQVTLRLPKSVKGTQHFTAVYGGSTNVARAKAAFSMRVS